jgi:hypothetical protein
MNWIEQMYHIEKWKKYSQSHEEAYLLHIFSNLKIENGFLVELGAWDGYHLSNTRYFIENGWDAILIDGDNRGNNEVKQHFIDAENVISIFKKYSTPKEFDFLCIDLDGNDIYILEKILTEFSPKVIVAEFNPYFKKGDSKTITYDPNHTWNNDTYYGFSFTAGEKIAKKYGYICIFQNDDLNMYFVKDSLIDGLYVPEIKYNEGSLYHILTNKTTWINY